MTVSKHELRLALQDQRFAFLLRVRVQLNRSDSRAGFQRTQPAGHEGERQRMRGGEAQRRGACLGDGAGFAGDASDLCLQILRYLAEPMSCFGQSNGLRAAVKQVDTEPLFQSPHAPAECRLRHVAFVGRAREVAAGCQREEIIEPRKIYGHGDAFKASKTR